MTGWLFYACYIIIYLLDFSPMPYFEKAIKKLQENGNRKIMGGLSAICGLFVINLLGMIFGEAKGWLLLMLVLSVLYIFCKLQKISEEIFDGWCEDIPLFVHIGLIVGTLIAAKPLIVKFYGQPTTNTKTSK